VSGDNQRYYRYEWTKTDRTVVAQYGNSHQGVAHYSLATGIKKYKKLLEGDWVKIEREYLKDFFGSPYRKDSFSVSFSISVICLFSDFLSRSRKYSGRISSGSLIVSVRLELRSPSKKLI